MTSGSNTRPLPLAVPALFAEEIRLNLEQMLASPAFGRSERPARFLRYLVEAALAGETNTLKESVIGCEVFSRPADWDPRLDPVVRQEAARLRKRIAQYYDSTENAPEVRIELPVGGYVPIFIRDAPSELVVVEPEVAPPPVVSDASTKPLAVDAPRKFSNRYYIGLGASLALLAGSLLLWRSLVQQQPPLSIVVIPFTNATGDHADQYFVDGLGSDLADTFSRFRKVRVVPRSAYLRLQGQATPNWRQLALRDGATHLLEGSVERRGDRVNFVVSLLEGATGKTLWTNTYRRTTVDINPMEASVTESVSAALHLVPSSQTSPLPLPSPESHDAYLKGMYELNRGTVESNAAAQAQLRRALALNPEYVQAYTGLAQAIWNRNIAAGTRPIMQERRQAEQLWEKALEIDPGYTPAHSGLAYFALQYDWDFKRAERELKAVLAAGENAGAEENYAALCLILGRRAEANRHIDYARQLTPNDPNHLFNQINLLSLADRYPEAEEACRRLMLLIPKAIGPNRRSGILSDEGKSKEAFQLLASMPQNNPSTQMVAAQINARSGNAAAVLPLLRPIEEGIEANGMFYYDLVIAYAAMGDSANAAKWMQRFMDAREGPALYFASIPNSRKCKEILPSDLWKSAWASTGRTLHCRARRVGDNILYALCASAFPCIGIILRKAPRTGRLPTLGGPEARHK